MFFNQNNQGSRSHQGYQNSQGGQGKQSEENNHTNQNCHNKSIVCPSKICEEITLSVPVEVRARADVKNIILRCGEHHIHTKRGHEKQPQTHKFEITKRISAQIPIDFIAEVEVRDESVDFDVH